MAPSLSLPVDAVLSPLRDALATRRVAVLQAPPGAGKTTRVPLDLLQVPWLTGQRILLLEPRRLAARAAARRMASTLGEPVGATVGWRMRLDTKVTAATRIEVVTEGVLTRMVQDDPSLDGVGLVIFDEFHERNLVADLGLALVLQTRALLRDDLRVLVMSATLDGTAVAGVLGDAPIIASEGRAFPVETVYSPPRPDQRLEGYVAATVRRALEAHEGDLLVFLPGAGEIRRTESQLLHGALPAGVEVVPLYGALEGEAQDRAIAPAPAGRRKVVLATSIAETSLTIEGVRVVVDAGLARVPRYSAATGMTRLDTVRVSRASAEQRRGRAGRVAPGVCYRCWHDYEDAALVPRALPEIRDADLAPLALDLAVMGIRDPGDLTWMDVPPAAAFARARTLLTDLGALDAAGTLTPHGRAMSALALHPRLAHLALRGVAIGDGALACDLAALLAERDVVRRDGGGFGRADADIALRIDALAGRAGDGHLAALGLRADRDGVMRVRDAARLLRRQLRVADDARDTTRCGDLLAYAFPDRIARRRADTPGRYLMRGGGGATMASTDPLARDEWVVIAETDGKREDAGIYLAAPITMAELYAHHAEQITRERDIAWDEPTQSVRARDIERLGALVLRERALADTTPAEIAEALVAALRSRGIAALPWSDSALRLRERLAFARHLEGDRWPDVSDAALLTTLDTWLVPQLGRARSLADVGRLDLAEALVAALPWEQRRRLDIVAPTHLTVPTGSRIPVQYTDPAAPVLAVRLQELFGLGDTPRVGDGRVPVTLHLLSPAQRPVQVTNDLAGFWRSSYFDVRKDLRGRYPRHPWPEDPLAATPTRRVKPRGE